MKSLITLLLLAVMAIPAQAGLSPKTDSEIYNDGLELLYELKFKKAEKKFRKALEENESFGEAHNNLAFCLRKQGAEYYEAALNHYNQAIALIPDAPEPYMYRGVLYVSMGRLEEATAEHLQLLSMNADELASELQWVIDNKREKEPAQFFGVTGKIEAP